MSTSSLYLRNDNQRLYQRCSAMFPNIDNIKITYNICKSDIDKIIQNVCIEFCDMTIFGYDKYHDKYWCKKYNKFKCVLSVEIKILSTGFNLSNIIIEPKIGDTYNIHLFVNAFNESIQMYNTSNFIRNMLRNY